MSVFVEVPENPTVALCYTFSQSLPHLINSLGKMGRKIIIFNKECNVLEQKITKQIQEAKILVPDLDIQQTSDWKMVQKASVIQFLNLDIDRASQDLDFYALCKLELKNRSLPNNCLVFFSGNYRGLIAANVYSLLFPNLAKRIYVISSIFYASTLIFGDKEKAARALAKPNGELFVYGGSEVEDEANGVENNLLKVDHLRGVWAHDEFHVLESEALFSAIDVALTTGNISSCEITGRIPGEEEVKEYDVNEEYLTWLPMNESVEINARGFFKSIRAVSASIEEVNNKYQVPVMSGTGSSEED